MFAMPETNSQKPPEPILSTGLITAAMVRASLLTGYDNPNKDICFITEPFKVRLDGVWRTDVSSFQIRMGGEPEPPSRCAHDT